MTASDLCRIRSSIPSLVVYTHRCKSGGSLSLKEKQVNAKRFLPRTARCSRQCGSPVLLQSTTASSMYTHPFTRDGIQCTKEDLRFHDRNYFGWLPYAPASIHLASVSEKSQQTRLLNLINSEQQCPKVSSHHSLLATLSCNHPKWVLPAVVA